MSSPLNPNAKEAGQPTIEEIKQWDADLLIEWIQRVRPKLLKGNDIEIFQKTGINGDAFLAGDRQFFKDELGLSPVVSMTLTVLAQEALSVKCKSSKRRRLESETESPNRKRLHLSALPGSSVIYE